MAKIGADFGKRERLSPEHLEGDAALLTITSVDMFKYDGQDTMVIKFEETGDAGMFINRTMLDALLEHLGDETDGWIGKVIPVEVRTVKYNSEETTKVYVWEAGKWADAFESAGEPVPDYCGSVSSKAEAVKAAKGTAKGKAGKARR